MTDSQEWPVHRAASGLVSLRAFEVRDVDTAAEPSEEVCGVLTRRIPRRRAHVGVADADTAAYRAHLPHPAEARPLGRAEVDIVDTPTNPPGSRRVATVETSTVAQPARLANVESAWGGELIELTAE